MSAAFAFLGATFRGPDDFVEDDGLDLGPLPLRVGAVADLFFFLPAMRENILSHAIFLALCGPLLEMEKPQSKFTSTNSYRFSTVQ